MSNIGDLRNSLVISTCLHIGMLLFLYFGAPSLFKTIPPAAMWRPVPVDIVEIGAITNTNINKSSDEEAKAIAAQPKPAPQAPENKPPEPPAKMAVTAPEPAKAATIEDGILPPEPNSKPKPIEAAKPKAPQPDPLASVLKNVARIKPKAATIEGPATEGKEGVVGGPKGFGPSLSDRLTISSEDALRRQISSCWNMPVGARNAEDLIVEVLIEVNPDRTVSKAEVVNQAKMSTDPYFRAAAESALRALRNPKCSPLELPADQYEQWKVIRFNFDPRDMI